MSDTTFSRRNDKFVMAKRKTASKMAKASRFNLALARAQGTAFAAALKHMATFVAHDGREVEKGEYLVSYAVERLRVFIIPHAEA